MKRICEIYYLIYIIRFYRLRVHILFEFQDGPWGGGNQFLKALKNEFRRMAVYEYDANNADVILFNSHHLIEQAEYLKKEYPEKAFIHRVDGPVQIVRGFDEGIDDKIFNANKIIADGTIFQSNWVKSESVKLGLDIKKDYAVIINAPDETIFYRVDNRLNPSERIKLIATSWSGNVRKGFDVYEWLDDNLDFDKYEMTFIGNSSVSFKRIIHKQPMNSHELSEELKKRHIYITASKHEPCSNALIEAMHCGLPALAYNNGGNPDIVGKGGELFLNNAEIIEKLDLISDNYEFYKDNINLPKIGQVAALYYNFMKRVYTDKINSKKKSVIHSINQYFRFKNCL